MRGALSLDVDMHGIGKSVAGVVTDRNFKDLACRIEVAAQDPEHRRIFLDLKSLGDSRICRDRLNILRNLAYPNACQSFNLAEERASSQIKLADRFAQHLVKIRICDRDGEIVGNVAADAVKTIPFAIGRLADLFSDGFRQWTGSYRRIGDLAVAGILQQLADIGERLVQRAASGSSWLDRRPRAAPALNEPFCFKPAQGFTNSEPADIVPLAQRRFGGKLSAVREPSREYFLAELPGKLKIARRLCFFCFGGRQSRLHQPIGLQGASK